MYLDEKLVLLAVSRNSKDTHGLAVTGEFERNGLALLLENTKMQQEKCE